MKMLSGMDLLGGQGCIFAKQASLRLARPLPNPIPRGEGIKLPDPNIFRFTFHPILNPALFDFQQPDSLSLWERVRERATNRKVRQTLKSHHS